MARSPFHGKQVARRTLSPSEKCASNGLGSFPATQAKPLAPHFVRFQYSFKLCVDRPPAMTSGYPSPLRSPVTRSSDAIPPRSSGCRSHFVPASLLAR